MWLEIHAHHSHWKRNPDCPKYICTDVQKALSHSWNNGRVKFLKRSTLLVLSTCLPDKLYCNQLGRQLIVYENHSNFPSPRARFLCACLPHLGEDWNSTSQHKWSVPWIQGGEKRLLPPEAAHTQGRVGFHWVHLSNPPSMSRKAKLL